jgi:hypothetical protein
MTAAPTDLPASALTMSRAATEHDLIARIARGQNLLRRTVHGRSDVIAFARDLAEWSGHNRDLLAKRFADHRLADAYSSAAEPFIVPAHDMAVAAQVDLLRRQLDHQLGWLEELRATLPERDEVPSRRSETHRPTHGRPVRTPTVLAASTSKAAVRVVGAVARATGMLPLVIEAPSPDGGSLLRTAEALLPDDAVAIVVIDTASAESLLALGYAAGALGTGDVIAVRTPGAAPDVDLSDIASVTIDAHDEWRLELERLLERAGFNAADVVAVRL